jgi:hypothetical protein
LNNDNKDINAAATKEEKLLTDTSKWLWDLTKGFFGKCEYKK